MQRLWGGDKLGAVLGKNIENDLTGESWELSGVNGNVSVIANGDYRGLKLTELINKFPEELLGMKVLKEYGKEFPILIKFIDANKDLSIQLHPNDALAKKRHNSLGKTEMWYIMDSEPDSELIIGFNEDVDEKIYTKSLEEDSLLDLLHFEKVEEGDTFFINAGKIHAIGKGVLLAEIQQTSDVTYRVFDYNRKDEQGNLRQLHTDLALAAIDYERKDDFKIAYNKEANTRNLMVNSAYFTTKYLPLDNTITLDLSLNDSFTIYMCVKGSVKISNESGEVDILRGETALVPASSKKVELITNGAELLEITI